MILANTCNHYPLSKCIYTQKYIQNLIYECSVKHDTNENSYAVCKSKVKSSTMNRVWKPLWTLTYRILHELFRKTHQYIKPNTNVKYNYKTHMFERSYVNKLRQFIQEGKGQHINGGGGVLSES